MRSVGEGLSLSTAGGSYMFEGGEGVLDMVMVGTRAANGQIGWDPEPDNDQWGIQPNWDPTDGGAVQIDATTDVGLDRGRRELRAELTLQRLGRRR